MKTLYEIWCRYRRFPTDPEYTWDLPLKDYVGHGEWSTFERHQVVSLDRDRIEKTLERLKIVSPSDYEYYVKEVHLDLEMDNALNLRG